MRKLFYTFVLGILLIPCISFAHPGNTDSSGCHTCRTNCSKWGLSTGEYHCHRAKALPQPKEPIKSHYSETGGYTTPAPEYKQPKIDSQKPVIKTKTQQNNNENKTVVVKKESWVIRLFKYLFD